MAEIGQDCNKHCDRVIHDLKDYLTVICEYLPREDTFIQADHIIKNSDGWQLTLGKC